MEIKRNKFRFPRIVGSVLWKRDFWFTGKKNKQNPKTNSNNKNPSPLLEKSFLRLGIHYRHVSVSSEPGARPRRWLWTLVWKMNKWLGWPCLGWWVPPVCTPRPTLHPLPASPPGRLPNTAHINGLPSPVAFQVSSANVESQKEFGGLEQSEVGVFISWTSSMRDCLSPAALQRSQHLSGDPLAWSRFQWPPDPHPFSLGVLCCPLWFLPYTLPIP